MGFKPPTLNLSLVPPPAGGGVVGGGWAKAAARPAQPSAADMQQGQGLIKVDSGKTVYSLKFFNLIRSAPVRTPPLPSPHARARTHTQAASDAPHALLLCVP